MQMHLISRLRDDADLQYLYYGPKTGKKGRPQKYDGKIDWNNIKDDYFEIVQVDDTTTIYSAVVYAKYFKCNIKISCVFFVNDKGKETRKIYFSSDLEMSATDILDYYRSRFQ